MNITEPRRFECHITVKSPGVPAIDWLAEAPETMGLSKQALKGVMQKGAVWLAIDAEDMKPQRLRRAKRLLHPGNVLHLYFDEKVLHEVVAEPKLFADLGDYSVWIKPKGMRSQGSKWSDHNTINRWIELNVPSMTHRPCLLIHRLDKGTDGLILIAHSHQVARTLRQMFEARKIGKTYQAWVEGKFPSATQHYLTPVNDKSAISHATLLEYDATKNRSLVSVNIETGRKHQIRQHLSEAGFPIVGDRLFNPNEHHLEDLQLTAVRIELFGNTPELQQSFKLTKDR